MKKKIRYHQLGSSTASPRIMETFSMIRVFLGKMGIGPLFLACACAAALMSSAASSIYPLIARYVIDEILVGGRAEHFWTLCIIGYLSASVGSILFIVPGYLFQKIEGAAKIAFNTEVHRNLLSMPLSFFQSQSTGALLSLVRQDLQAVFSLFSRRHVFGDAKKIMLVVMGGCAMLWLHQGMGLLCLAVVLLSSALARIPLPLQRKLRDERIRLEASAGDQLTESLICIGNIKASVNEDHENERYLHRLKAMLENELKVFKGRFLLVGKACELGRHFLTSIVGVYGSWRIVRGDWTLGSMTAFFVYYGYFNSGTSHLVNRWLGIRRAASSFDRLNGLLNYMGTEESVAPLTPVPPLREEFVFHDVRFSYDEDRTVLQGVSFTIPSGMTTAVVGPNGAGKSTIAGLLFRFIDPDSGFITAGGRDIRSYFLKQYQSRIGIILQDGMLFNRSLHENIEYGNRAAGEAEVREAARLADVHGFSENLPSGFDTLLGERGSILSAGERQRVAIAREIVHKPDLLIMDEASSSLDGPGEKRMYQCLAGQTTLLISHHPGTVIRADHIIVLDQGKVVAAGRHEDLIRSCGTYQELFNVQREKTSFAVI